MLVIPLVQEMLKRAAAVNLDNTDNIPDGKIRQGEVVVGELPDNLRRLYVVMIEFGKEHDTLAIAMRKRIEAEGIDFLRRMKPDELKDTMRPIVLAREKFEMAQSCCLVELMHAFPKAVEADRLLTVCEGWQVVSVLVRQEMPVFLGVIPMM